MNVASFNRQERVGVLLFAYVCVSVCVRIYVEVFAYVCVSVCVRIYVEVEIRTANRDISVHDQD